VNRIDQETEKRRGPTRAVDPFKKRRRRTFFQVIDSRLKSFVEAYKSRIGSSMGDLFDVRAQQSIHEAGHQPFGPE
jgi:hypothetical protein